MFLFSVVLTLGIAYGNETLQSNGTMISDASGTFIRPAIIDGEVTDLKAFPSAGRLYIFQGKNSITCTSEIIHRKLVITAAHCARHHGTMFIVVGNSDQDDFVKGVDLQYYIKYKVIKKFIHPRYNPLSYKHDVAILKLSRPMSHLGYALIPISYDRIVGRQMAIIYGWGATEVDPHNNKLFMKKLTVHTCTLPDIEDYELICLDGPGAKKGDSGGAVIVEGKLQGICSFSRDDVDKITGRTITSYFYIALWEEKVFVERILLKNRANYNRCFLYLTIVPFILLFRKT